MDKRHKYFGFEISISPYSKEFQNSCLRTPDFIFEISSIKSKSLKGWLVLWRSYENCLSERGFILKGGREDDPNNNLAFLPLSVVLFGFADMNIIGRVCKRFFSIVPRSADNKSKCDIPPINLSILRARLSCCGSNIHIEVCTLRHLMSLYRRTKLIATPLWKVPNKIIERYAFSLFARASYIVSIMNDQRSFQYMLPFYRELRYYGGLLLGSFEDKNFHTAREEEKGRKLFRNIMFTKWYAGSQSQQEMYPSGLMKDWAEDIERYVLYDFQPGRRLKYSESKGNGYIIECKNDQDAMYFDTTKRRHILPENTSQILIHSSTKEWIHALP